MRSKIRLFCSSAFPRFKAHSADHFLVALTVAIVAAAIASPASANVTAESVLHSFNGAEGVGPACRLVQSADGSLLGTTVGGGRFNHGTVFKLTPDGTLTTLHSFTGSDGYDVDSGLTPGNDGNYYGTTYGGGSGGKGTIYKITPDGAFSTLHSFTSTDGANPQVALTLGDDGKFYGTTIRGGTKNRGTLFSITPDGLLTTLHSFSSQANDGSNPSSRVVQGPNGSFYGTTGAGGPNGRADAQGDGTVYKFDADGSFTLIYAFDDVNGAAPDGFGPTSLSLGEDGDLYGITSQGGAHGQGTVFKITPAGTFLTLRSDTAFATGDLFQAKDGNFYGTTNQSTVFKMTPSGALTTLFEFANAGEGKAPLGGIMQGADGAFYGTTSQGGADGEGTVFKLADATIQFTSSQFTVDEAAGVARIQISRSGTTQGAVSVYLSTIAGTATRNVDYKSTTDRVISWADGDASTKTTNIPIINDTLPEPDETLSLVLTDFSGETLSTAILTILDDDTVIPGAGQIQFSTPTYQVDEAAGYARITLARVGGAKGPVSILLSTTGGTATPGADYKPVNDRTIQWADGDASTKTTNIQLDTAAVLQGSETVQLAMAGPTGGAVLGKQAAAVLTIIPTR